MKKLIAVAIAVVGVSAFAGKIQGNESAKMLIDYKNYETCQWSFMTTMQHPTLDSNKDVRAFALTAISGRSRNLHGVALGLGHRRDQNVIGAQMNWIMSVVEKNVIGYTGAIVSKVGGKVMGAQCGAVCMADTLQAGTQISLVGKVKKQAHGCLLGIFVNKVEEWKPGQGCQVGLICINPNSKFPVFPFVNGVWGGKEK